MTLLALSLILTAAFLHASWNLLAKRSGGGAIFVWLFAGLSSLIYAPFVASLVILQPPHMGLGAWLCVAGTALLHLGYFLSLQRGYRSGDLSLVYPLARGTGPLLATVLAIALLGEQPSGLALVGAALIIVSVFILSGGLQGLTGTRPPAAAIGYGLLTGVLIASYTLLDKYAVSALLIPPLLYDWLGNLGRMLLITPYALRRRGQIASEWRANRGAIIGVAVLSPLAYILVLTAMTFTPVSYVAPAREVSILIAVVLGARLLDEGQIRTRLLGAAGMICGIAALVLG
ncbi:EamA family transporter [Salinisphaera aquimarina]|uniref:EamA family transporter n=1 Tax=Salinisphaera aquimarina TaxID=2094031 RepID=A0ABV7EI67_9GAMM